MAAVNADPRAKALEIHARLIDAYGRPVWQAGDDPVSQIVNTILSQSTTDINRDRAYRRLRERFPTWEAVRQAPGAEVQEAIRPAGLSAQRAPRIQETLDYIVEQRGELSLDFLRQMPVAEAQAWLTRIKGIGPKTAAIVLLFSLGMPAFPVDTHVQRVCQRLGLAPANAAAPKIEGIIESLMPADTFYPFHLNLIAHGRRVCKAQRPACAGCLLNDLCADYASRRQP
jgi:endonuclease-3